MCRSKDEDGTCRCIKSGKGEPVEDLVVVVGWCHQGGAICSPTFWPPPLTPFTGMKLKTFVKY